MQEDVVFIVKVESFYHVYYEHKTEDGESVPFNVIMELSHGLFGSDEYKWVPMGKEFTPKLPTDINDNTKPYIKEDDGKTYEAIRFDVETQLADKELTFTLIWKVS